MKDKLLNLIMIYGEKVFHSEAFQSIFALWSLTIGMLVVWLFLELVVKLFAKSDEQEIVPPPATLILPKQTTMAKKIKKPAALKKKPAARKVKKRTK